MSGRSIAKTILVAAGVIAALYFLYVIRQVIGLTFIAIFLAVALGPAVDFFHRVRVPRAAAILSVFLLIFAGVFLIGLLVVPPVVDEVDEFVTDVPRYIDQIRDSPTLRRYDDRYGITEQLATQAETLPRRLGDAAGALQNVTVGVFSAIFQLVTVLVMTFFLLLDGKRAVAFFYREVGPEREQRLRTIADHVYGAVGGYVTGAFSIAFIAGVSSYVMLLALGVPFAVPLAVLMAFFVLIPLVGATIGGAVVAVVAGVDNFPTGLIAWVVFLVVYQQIENNVLQPFVYRRTLALHPLLVIVAVLVGASLLGILGALLAIPAAATVQILVKDYYHFRRNPLAKVGPDQTEPTTELGRGSPRPVEDPDGAAEMASDNPPAPVHG